MGQRTQHTASLLVSANAAGTSEGGHPAFGMAVGHLGFLWDRGSRHLSILGEIGLLCKHGPRRTATPI